MADQPSPALSGILLNEEVLLTLDELANACAVQASWIVELVEEGVLEPQGDAPERWRFSGIAIGHVRTAHRLQRDLDIDLAGLAVVLELLDEIEALRMRLSFFGG